MEINSKSEELFVLEVDFILGAYEVSDVIFAFVDKSFDVWDNETELLLGEDFVDEVEKFLQSEDFLFSSKDQLLDEGFLAYLLLVLVMSSSITFYRCV